MARSSVDTLLELLNHVPDAAVLEHLIEPAHLRTLLVNAGRDDEWIRKQLASRNPGELLLELFEHGAKSDELVAQLPPMAPRSEKAAATQVSRRGDTPRAGRRNPFQMPGTTLNSVGGIVAIAVPTAASMLASGMLPLWDVGSTLSWTLVAAVGAALGLAIHAHGRVSRVSGAIGGSLLGAGAVLATVIWVDIRPTLVATPMVRLELVASLLVGALPGVLAYRGLSALLPAPEAS